MSDVEALPVAISVPMAAQLLSLSSSSHRFAASCDLSSRRVGDRIYVVTSRRATFHQGRRQSRMTWADLERDGD